MFFGAGIYSILDLVLILIQMKEGNIMNELLFKASNLIYKANLTYNNIKIKKGND